MSFEVVWPDLLTTLLARQYVLARTAGFGTPFTQAVQRIENRLSADPFADSESRTDAIRVMIDPPVTIHYEVDPAVRRVTLLDVRFARPRQR